MASRPVSLVASILLNPASRDKRVKGFKKQLAPLPWYTCQQAESVAREQRLARESSDQLDASSDPLLQILKQKDMKMKRTLSQFLSDDDDTESVSDAKKSKTTSTSSPELLTPTTPPPSSPRISSREGSPPPEAAPPPLEQRIASGRYRLDDDPDIEPREYELIIMEAKLNRAEYSDNFAETDLQTTDGSISEKETQLSLDKTGEKVLEVSDSTESNGKDEECSEHTTDSSVTLTEQELAEVTQHQFMLSYQSMCYVLGVSQEEGDKALKSWQNSKDKPSGILKTPTEKFGTRPDNSVSDSQEKVVSFCLPTQQASASPPVPAPSPDPLSLPPPPPRTQEPTTPTLSPPQGGLMSTPVPTAPSAPHAGTLTPAALSHPPPLPQDISIIPSATSQPNIFPLSSTPSFAFSLTTQANTSMVPSTIRSDPIQTQQSPSLLSQLTASPTILPDSNGQSQPAPTGPLDTPLPEPPQSETQSNSPFAFLSKVTPPATTTQSQSLLTSQTITTSSQTKLQSSNNLFKLPNPPSQPLFQTTSTPIQRGIAPQTPQSISFKTPNPSLFNKPQEKPAKSFHNLEISYSIPPNAGSLFPPLPSSETAQTQPFSAPNESPVPNLFKRQHAIAFSSPEPSSSSLPSNPVSSLQLSSATKPNNTFSFKPTADTQGTAFAPKVPFSFNFGQSATQSSPFQGAAATPHFEGAYGNTAARRFAMRSSHTKKRRK